MKSLLTLSGSTACLIPALLTAAPVMQPTSVRTEPQANAPVLTVISPGTELPPAAAGATAPAGWVAVQLAGPHEVYVDNRDLNKALEVKPGTAYRTEPSGNAPILGTAEASDTVEITGLRGRWTQLRLNKTLTGYVQQERSPAPSATPAASVASTPAPARNTTPATATPSSPAPSTSARQVAAPAPAPGRAVPISERDGGHNVLPRLFEGRFVSTRSPLRPRRPYDYALEDENGTRIAYVDISRLLLTDQIENYIGRHVSAYGATRAVPDTKDIVVTAESLQLR